MKKKIKKELFNMLKTSITITLNAVDEKATSKISKTIEKASERLAKKFGKNLKTKAKLKTNVEQLVGKKKRKAIEPVETIIS